MNKRDSASVVALGLALLPLLANASCGCGGKRQTGGVFVMTNANRNTVASFHVNESGTLVSSGNAESTQGKGFGSSSNPLSSQGALTVSGDGRWLVALNAGSNEISIFNTSGNKLTFSSKSGSKGQFPSSVAASGNRIFVLNKKSPNIAGFSINKNGELEAIDAGKAVRSLAPSTNYSQIGISPNGKWLVVSNESGNLLLAYALNGDTLAKDPLTIETSGSGPSAFAFDRHNNLIVAESMSGTVSSYSLSGDGIKVITAALPIEQKMPRWIVCNGSFAYTSAMSSGAFPAISIADDGQLTLVNRYYAGSNDVTELAVNYAGDNLYTFSPKTNIISHFHIETDGTLTYVDNVLSYFGPSAQGIAAN